MPIILPGTTTTTTTALSDTGLMSFLRAKRIVARGIGGSTKPEALEEAGDYLIQALEDLNLHEWEFLLKTYDLSISANLADYSLPQYFRKAYTVRLTTNSRPLHYLEQRLYDRLTWTQTGNNNVPVAYNFFPSSTIEDLDPQHTLKSIRFLPTPSAADTAEIKYYRDFAVINDEGETLDLPRAFQWWPICKAKAMMFMDHGERAANAAYWERESEKLLRRMLAQDQEHPDNDMGFVSSDEHVSVYNYTHPYATLMAMDGR